MDEVQVGERTIAFDLAGEGSPVVFLHGILGDHRMWRRQVHSFSARHTVLAWDAPGCGGSGDPDERDRMPEYADHLAGLLDAVGIDRSHVVGLSWGGALAIELARRYPRRVASLVLAGAYAGWAGSLPEKAVTSRLRQAIEESELPPDRFIPRWIPQLLTENAPPGAAKEVAAIMSDFHPAGYRTMARAVAEADLRAALGTIEAPTLVLHAGADVRAPLEVAEALREGMPDAALATLAGVGHLSNIDSPARFDEIVLDFVGGVDHRTRPDGNGTP